MSRNQIYRLVAGSIFNSGFLKPEYDNKKEKDRDYYAEKI